jgi:hypothetical protein
LSALHDVVPLDDVVEFVAVVVLPTFVELVTVLEFVEVELTEFVTFVELLESIELVAPVELRASIELVAPAATMSSAEPHAHNPSATTVTRYLYLIVSTPGCAITASSGLTATDVLPFSIALHSFGLQQLLCRRHAFLATAARETGRSS